MFLFLCLIWPGQIMATALLPKATTQFASIVAQPSDHPSDHPKGARTTTKAGAIKTIICRTAGPVPKATFAPCSNRRITQSCHADITGSASRSGFGSATVCAIQTSRAIAGATSSTQAFGLGNTTIQSITTCANGTTIPNPRI